MWKTENPFCGWVYSDGGREASGYKSKRSGDCSARAIAIATGLPYADVCSGLDSFARTERKGKRKKKISNSQTGVYATTTRKYLDHLGWTWVPTMGIGTGCRVHLRADELPKGRLIVAVSKHLTAVIDGIIHDTFNPDRHGTRCVYGYWHGPNGGQGHD